MEEHGIEENAVLPNSEKRSLEEFKQNILGSIKRKRVINCSSRFTNLCAEYNDDQLEGIFFKHYGRKPV